MKKLISTTLVAAMVLGLAAAVMGLVAAAPAASGDEEKDVITDIEIDEGGIKIRGQSGDTMFVDWEKGINVDTVGEDVIRIGSDIIIGADQIVEGDVVAVMADVRIDGYVEGDAVAVGGNLTIGPGARVDGDGVSVGGAVENLGGVIRGETVSVGVGRGWMKGPGFLMGGFFSSARRLLMLIMWLIVLVVLGALCLAVLRRPVDIVSDRVRKEAFLNGLIGLLAWVLVIPIIVLLAITIIGIPIAILVPFILAIMLLLGFIGVSAATGQKFVEGGNGGAYRGMAIGVVMLYGLVILGALLKLGPGPVHFAGSIIGFIGWAVVFVATTVGLGAVVTSRFGTREKNPKIAPPKAASFDAPPGQASR